MIHFVVAIGVKSGVQSTAILRRVFETVRIEMHSLVELWALLALFLSKIFDQVGFSE